MGVRLAAYYTEAEGLAGLDGKIQLAMLTRISSTRALLEPDSPENLSKFEGAMYALRRGRAHVAGIGAFSSPPRASERPPPQPAGAMADGEELFWGILEALHDSVVGIFDRDARCLMVWEARSLEARYPAREAHHCVGDTIARVVSAHCAAQIRALHEGGPPHREELACSIHGCAAWLCVSLSAAHDRHGDVIGVYAFVQDVTEHKTREHALRGSEESLRAQLRALQVLLTEAGEDAPDLPRLTEAAAGALSASYASVWRFDASQGYLRCLDCWDGREHRAGAAIADQEQLPYLDALRGVRALAVEDAQADLRTRRFVQAHPFAADVGPALYVPLRRHGELIGVLGLELEGRERAFEAEQENLALSVARLVGQALPTEDARPEIAPGRRR